MGDLDVSAQDVASRECLFARFALIARCFAVILLVSVAVCRSVAKKVGRSVVRCMSDKIGLIIRVPKAFPAHLLRCALVAKALSHMEHAHRPSDVCILRRPLGK